MITGWLVGYLKLNGMITSLGMQNIIYSAALIYTGNQYFGLKNTDTWFAYIGRNDIMGIPGQLIIYGILIIIFQFILRKCIFGKKLIAVGNNAVCSDYSGIDSKKVVMQTFIVSGLCAALAGLILASRSMSGQCNAGQGMEFDALTATILGGTSLLGGSGSVAKSFLGVLIIGILKSGFLHLGWNDYIQWLAQCIIIVIVVWLDIASSKKVNK
jgi:Ribose/xylose/arabinose/galactoside ABC-type transport systems, permease components